MKKEMLKKGRISIVVLLVMASLLLVSCSKGSETGAVVADEFISDTAAAQGNSADDNAKESSTIDGSATDTSVSGSSAREIVVKAYNFGFTPNEIKAKLGEEITLKLVSESGFHGISIPELGVSTTTVSAGQETSVTFTADKKGTFNFRCNVYCGDGHREMTGKVIVE